MTIPMLPGTISQPLAQAILRAAQSYQQGQRVDNAVRNVDLRTWTLDTPTRKAYLRRQS